MYNTVMGIFSRSGFCPEYVVLNLCFGRAGAADNNPTDTFGIGANGDIVIAAGSGICVYLPVEYLTENSTFFLVWCATAGHFFHFSSCESFHGSFVFIKWMKRLFPFYIGTAFKIR